MGSNSKGNISPNQNDFKDCCFLTKKQLILLFSDFRKIHRSLLMVLVATKVVVIVLSRIKLTQK